MQPSALDVPHFTFSNGVQIPVVGYGTSRTGDGLEQALETAINCGYRQIDTAQFYGNEQIIGKVLKKLIKEGKITRQELFITTKLHSQYYHGEDVEPAIRRQLANLQLDYVDLYLIHTPWGTKKHINDSLPIENGFVVADPVDHMETWQAMELVYKKGLTRSIGLSNFFASQILNVYDKSAVKPHNLQLACHAYWPQEELYNLCSKLNIVMTAYGPLGSPAWHPYSKAASQLPPDTEQKPVLLNDEIVGAIASKYKKTSAQILLKWLVQRGINVIPKSVTEHRIKENINIFDFELSDDDFKRLSNLPTRNPILGRMDSL